ncbi:MAG: 3-phosphoshikimate 1-carboxyvinyltransferase [Myxococcota bacterium]
MSRTAPHSDVLPIAPRGGVDAVVAVPGSKSLTNRALLVAALADGQSHLEGALDSDDTVAMRRALAAMGVAVETDGSDWTVRGTGGRLAAPSAPIHVGNAGTAMRFLAAAATLASGETVLDGTDRMRERPIGDLVDALRALGARVAYERAAGFPPVRVLGGGLPGGAAEIDARRSSQFVSAVLLAAPYAARDVELAAKDGAIVSRPYVDLTLELMEAFGAEARFTTQDDEAAPGRLFVRAGRPYRARRYAIEPDASSAVYPLCAAAIAGGRARVVGIPPGSRQSDLRIVDLLERMGCSVVRGDAFVEVEGPASGLHSLGRVDMNDLPDAALAYAVVALFADGPTTIENVANLRIKETDRLHALETELRRLGARATASADALEVRPGPLHGATIETYDDHRMAMSFALAGLRVPGVAIRDPGCVAKTWPDYFASFASW